MELGNTPVQVGFFSEDTNFRSVDKIGSIYSKLKITYFHSVEIGSVVLGSRLLPALSRVRVVSYLVKLS